MLTTLQPEYTGAYSVFPYSAALESRYCIKLPYSTEPFCMAIRSGQSLRVPRETAPIGKNDGRVVHWAENAINCTLVPRNEEQGPLSEASIELLKKGRSHVFQAPTGWGKSVVGSYIASQIGMTTLIVVNKEDLMDAWYDALVNVLKVPPSKVGRVQQDTCVWKGCQFVIAMIHSLVIEDRYPDEMYRYFGMMILDECDTVAADTFVNACWKVPASLRLGFTATTRRGDGKWPVVEAHLGPVAVRGSLVPMAPKILVKKTGWKIPRRRDLVDGELRMVPIPHAPGRMGLVTRAMVGDQARNSIILDFLVAAYNAGRSCVGLADTRDHLDRMFQMLTQAGVPGNDIGFYVGGLSTVERDIAKKKKVVLATYKMCDRGTNVPHWDSLAMMTPRAEVEQSVGRVIRFVDGKKQPVVLDLVDYDKIFHSFHKSRLKTYYKLGSVIVTL